MNGILFNNFSDRVIIISRETPDKIIIKNMTSIYDLLLKRKTLGPAIARRFPGAPLHSMKGVVGIRRSGIAPDE